jgi:hypothetical protein
MKVINSIQSLVLTIWMGSQWSIGYIAAPVLFATLDDRSLAGSLAGKMFLIVAIIGLCAAVILMATHFIVEKAYGLRQWRFWVLLSMLVLVAVGLFVVQPMIADVKAIGLEPGSEAAKTFGKLHGVSSVLYLIVSLLGALLVYTGMTTRTKRPRPAIGEFQ